MAFGTGGGMGRGGGVQVMGRSGGGANDPDSNYFLYKQQLADALLRSGIAAPAKPELSWTQGAARMATALLGAYKQNQLEGQMQDYQGSRSQDMQTMANALQNGGNLGDAMSQMHNPSTQNQLMQMMMQNNMMNFQMNKMGQQQQTQFQNAQSLQNSRQQGEGAINQQKQQGDLIKAGYEADRKQQADLKAPVAQGQQQLLDLEKAYQDPSTPPEVKAAIPQMYQQKVQTLAAMGVHANTQGQPTGNAMALPGAGGIAPQTPSLTPMGNNGGTPPIVNASMGSAGAATPQPLLGSPPTPQNAKGGATGATPDLLAASNKAKDSLSMLNQVQHDIESGHLTNIMLTGPGEDFEKAKALAGQPNSLDAIGRYKQLSANSQVQALGDIGNTFKNAGIQARITKPLVDLAQNTQFAPNEMLDSAYPKIAVNKQILERAAASGDIAQQYVLRNGTLVAPDPKTGSNFEQTYQNFMQDNPVLSFPEWQKKAADLKAQKTIEAQNQGYQVPSDGQAQPQNPSPTPAPDPKMASPAPDANAIVPTDNSQPSFTSGGASQKTPDATGMTNMPQGSSISSGVQPAPIAPQQPQGNPQGQAMADPLQLAPPQNPQGSPPPNGIDPKLLAQYLQSQQQQQMPSSQLPNNVSMNF